jgi:hypothetical protein
MAAANSMRLFFAIVQTVVVLSHCLRVEDLRLFLETQVCVFNNGAGGLGSTLPGYLAMALTLLLAIELSDIPATNNVETLRSLTGHRIVPIHGSFLDVDLFMHMAVKYQTHVHVSTMTAFGLPLKWTLLIMLLKTPLYYDVVALFTEIDTAQLTIMGLNELLTPIFDEKSIHCKREFFILRRDKTMGAKR